MYGKETENMMQIRRADILLIILFLLLSLGILILFIPGKKEGKTLLISCDGKELASVALSGVRVSESSYGETSEVRYGLLLYPAEEVSLQWYKKRPEIPDGVSYNLLCISAEGVSMEAADCRDQICVHHRTITGGGESIICLPHKLVLEIVGGTEEESLDRMVK